MTTDKSSEREAFERLQRAVDSYPGTGPAALLKAAMQVLAARAALPQQALDAPSDDLRELGKWLNEEPNRPIDRSALARVLAWAQVSAPQQAQDIAEASGGAEGGPEEDRIEAAFWRFDARHKGHGEWRQAPMSERDAFKAEMRNALHAEAVRAEMRMVAKGWRKPGPQQAQETSLPPQGAASLLPEPVAAQGCADYLRSLANLCFLHNRQASGVLREWAAALAASPAPAPQEPARPIAWMAMAFGVPAQATTDEPTAIRWRKAGGDVRPLYASPAPGELGAAWRPIETAPKDGTDIWAAQAGAPECGVISWDEDLCRWQDLMDDCEPPNWQPTHWMPLPRPPSAAPAPQEVVPVAIRAQPIVWEIDERGEQWTESRYGFYITRDRDEDRHRDDDEPYFAAWGEGDEDRFSTLEEAQAWCQKKVDAWMAENAIATPPSAAPARAGE